MKSERKRKDRQILRSYQRTERAEEHEDDGDCRCT